MVNKILNISMVTKIIKKLDLYEYSLLEMSIYKIYFDKTKCACFMEKDKKCFEKYMKT